MFGCRNIGRWAAFVGLMAGMWALPAHATPESRAAVLGLLYRPGARETALGGAGVAGALGSASSYYNPALLSWQKESTEEGVVYPRSVGSTYYKILKNFNMNDMYYMYFPMMVTIPDWGQFAFNVTYLSLGEQTRVDEIGNVLGTFTSYTVALGASYSSQISDRTSAGLTAKWFYDHLADAGTGTEKGKASGSGFALDLGAAYNVSERLMLGVALSNYGPNVQFIDAKQASPTPINFNVGTSWKLVDTEYNDITILGDLYKPLVQDYDKDWYLAPVMGWFDDDVYEIEEGAADDGTDIVHTNTLREETGQIDVHTGIEYSYADYVALRTGYFRDWDGHRKWLTFGAGFRLPISSAAVAVDFAYIHAMDTGTGGDPNDGMQVYTIGITF